MAILTAAAALALPAIIVWSFIFVQESRRNDVADRVASFVHGAMISGWMPSDADIRTVIWSTSRERFLVSSPDIGEVLECAAAKFLKPVVDGTVKASSDFSRWNYGHQ